PSFRSAFLQGCCEAFGLRSRSLKHRGSLTYTTDAAEVCEWITMKYLPLVGPYIILRIVADHRVSLYLRSRRNHTRGKILLAMEEVVGVGGGKKSVEVFEWTVEQASGFHDGELHEDLATIIKDEWNKVILRVAAHERDC